MRIGKLERSDKFDGEYYQWRHTTCFFNKFSWNPPRSSELSGLDQLKWEDQVEVKSKTADGIEENTEKQVSLDAGMWDTATFESKDDVLAALSAEYARSGRSKCKGCYKQIEDRSLRIGVTVDGSNCEEIGKPSTRNTSTMMECCL